MTTTSPPKDTFSLPPEKVFSIQIGTELFRLSGASIASDAPSYFSQFFEDQIRKDDGDASSLRTLYIDRDPCTFQEIARHLQGYHVRPRNGTHFVRLFADAQFYSLPRLTSQLFESDIFIQIGDRDFQIPRDIFNSPGNSPNFFSLGFAAFFASPSEVFPGLDRKGLLRPPAIEPPRVINRSGEVFAELLHMLRGYALEIRSEEHRAQLLRDCRYFHLRGLEQQLIPHHISSDSFGTKSEIVILLEDVRQSGIDIYQQLHHPGISTMGWTVYTRPFVETAQHHLIVEVGGGSVIISRAENSIGDPDSGAIRAHFLDPSHDQMTSLCQLLVTKLCTSTKTAAPSIRDAKDVRVDITEDTDLIMNGEHIENAWVYCKEVLYPGTSGFVFNSQSKRRRVDDVPAAYCDWVVHTGQWKLKVVQAKELMEAEVHLVAVKLDAYMGEKVRNRARGFLSA